MYDKPDDDWRIERVKVFRELGDKPWGDALCKVYIRDGMAEAAVQLAEHLKNDPVPSLDAIVSAHYLSFRQVYPFAGQLRQRGQDAGFGVEGVPWRPAFHSRIIPELDRLGAATRGILEKARTPEERSHAIALYHAQFERIHPFLGGNGRVGRRVAEGMIRNLFGREPKPVLDRGAYMEALLAAQNRKDLGPLSYVMTEVHLPEELRHSDYKMNFWPAIYRKRSEVAGVVVSIKCRDPEQAVAVDDLPFAAAAERELLRRGTARGLSFRVDLERQCIDLAHVRSHDRGHGHEY